MKRKEFLKTCGFGLVGLPFAASLLQSYGGIHYAAANENNGVITIAKSQFIINPQKPEKLGEFVMVQSSRYKFPLCIYRTDSENYVTSLMRCTHRGCELNVGGGIYSCPCHGSEFTNDGTVMTGPADENLQTFTTTTDAEHITIYLS